MTNRMKIPLTTPLERTGHDKYARHQRGRANISGRLPHRIVDRRLASAALFCQNLVEVTQPTIKPGRAIFRAPSTQPPDGWLTAADANCDLGIRKLKLAADGGNNFLSGIHAANIRE